MDTHTFGRACRYGDTLAVRHALVHSGVDPSAHGNAALCVASMHGHRDVVQCLLEDPRVRKDRTGCTVALQDALENGHQHVSELLLSFDVCEMDALRGTPVEVEAHLVLRQLTARTITTSTP